MQYESRISRGEGKRLSYVKDLGNHGIPLVPYQNRTLWETPSGQVVGIGYCSEHSGWSWPYFLGLPLRPMDVAVALCETAYGQLLDFVLPRDFLARIWDSLGEGARQKKLHIRWSQGEWWLQLPGRSHQSISSYLHAITNLN